MTIRTLVCCAVASGVALLSGCAVHVHAPHGPAPRVVVAPLRAIAVPPRIVVAPPRRVVVAPRYRHHIHDDYCRH